MTKRRWLNECGCGCGKSGWNYGRGWIGTCYERWRAAGRPAGGPPPRLTREQVTERLRTAQAAMRGEPKTVRVEDFQTALARRNEDGSPYTVYQAARAAGISPRTGQRYATELRAAGRLP
jgi:hypothetical protein